jgi:uncharacterized membrane protein
MSNSRRRRVPRRFPRRAVLTIHIIASVGLLGDCAGLLAVAVQAATTSDSAVAEGSRQTLEMFGMVFGIPLSLLAVFTGVILAIGTKWGVFRYPWVTIKLALLVSVILVGAVVVGPNSAREGREGVIVAAGIYDVLVLCTATGLSVFKPGGTRAHRRRAGAQTST